MRQGTPQTGCRPVAGTTQTDNHSHTQRIANEMNATKCTSLDCGCGPREREPTQTWEDHANSTQKGLGHMVDLKLLAVRGVRILHWPVCGPDLLPTENM